MYTKFDIKLSKTFKHQQKYNKSHKTLLLLQNITTIMQ